MNPKRMILVVEDEDSISNFISSALKVNGYAVQVARDGNEGKSLCLSLKPDLVLLDLGLPDMDGIEVLSFLREWSQIPIIIVSSRGREAEKVEALDLGADDYITKPFGISELLARVRAALRHGDRAEGMERQGRFSEVLQVQDLVVDSARHTVTVGGREVHFTQNEFKMIELLARHAGKVLTYDFIMREIWGPYTSSDNQILRVNMANIRRKLEEDLAEPKYILTELGVGYRMLD